MKNKDINMWFWKWHFLAGIISLPFVILLSITGLIYLFKDDYEWATQKHIREVAIGQDEISFQTQWEIVKKSTGKKPDYLVMPNGPGYASEFVFGQFSDKYSVFINPYDGKATGDIIVEKTSMNTIKKLHGELLAGSYGTKIVELIASWMFVLIVTGIYIWWPQTWKASGTLIPRLRAGKRIFYRDMHAVTGFWISILLLMTLTGGMPWTDVFGASFKWVQKVTGTGYPATWSARTFTSSGSGEALTLDHFISEAKKLDLDGEIEIHLPKGPQGVYSISNTYYPDQNRQVMIHYDQYTGVELHRNNWSDVGILMRGRMWFMAFHQGQFGAWNRWLMILTALALFTMSLSACISYLKRKPRNSWGIPQPPSHFKPTFIFQILIGFLCLLFPMFGASVILIFLFETILFKKLVFRKKIEVQG